MLDPTRSVPERAALSIFCRRGAVPVKALIALGMGALIVLVLVFALRGGEREQTGTGEIYRVATTSFDVLTTSSGELQAKNQTKLVSKVQSQTMIIEIVPEGNFVRRGDLLVKLSSDELQRNLDNEMLGLESARSDLIAAENALHIQVSDNDSALRKAELKLELAILERTKWEQGDVRQRREEISTAIDRAEREFTRLRDKYANSQELFEKAFISKDELDQDELRFIEAESALRLAKLRDVVFEEFEYEKDNKRLESDIEEAAAELERVKTNNSSNLANRQADLNNRRAQLAIREDRVAKLKEQIANCDIYAPTDGLVVYATSLQPEWRFDSRGPLQVGRQVSHNEELIVLPDTTLMIAAVKIHESLVGRIRPGIPARVTIDAAEGRVFQGVVSDIGIMAESGGWRDPNLREYQVKIDLDLEDENHGLKPSMRAEAEIVLARVEDAIAVPITAVFSDGPVQYVYSPRGGRFERIPIGIGRRSDTLVEVVIGLQERQNVLLYEPPVSRIIDQPFNSALLDEIAAKTGGGRGARVMPAAAVGMLGEGEQSDSDAELDVVDAEIDLEDFDIDAMLKDLDLESIELEGQDLHGSKVEPAKRTSEPAAGSKSAETVKMRVAAPRSN